VLPAVRRMSAVSKAGRVAILCSKAAEVPGGVPTEPRRVFGMPSNVGGDASNMLGMSCKVKQIASGA
jgi:hypothetical protein